MFVSNDTPMNFGVSFAKYFDLKVEQIDQCLVKIENNLISDREARIVFNKKKSRMIICERIKEVVRGTNNSSNKKFVTKYPTRQQLSWRWNK